MDVIRVPRLPWIVEVRNGTTNVVVDYRISICSALSQPIESPCQHDAAVCRRTNHTDAVLLGHLSDRVISIDRATGALRLLLKGGATCPGDRTQTLQTQINFECGKTLVSVVFVVFFFFPDYNLYASSLALIGVQAVFYVLFVDMLTKSRRCFSIRQNSLRRLNMVYNPLLIVLSHYRNRFF